jgi:hypothetical protein
MPRKKRWLLAQRGRPVQQDGDRGLCGIPDGGRDQEAAAVVAHRIRRGLISPIAGNRGAKQLHRPACVDDIGRAERHRRPVGREIEQFLNVAPPRRIVSTADRNDDARGSLREGPERISRRPVSSDAYASQRPSGESVHGSKLPATGTGSRRMRSHHRDAHERSTGPRAQRYGTTNGDRELSVRIEISRHRLAACTDACVPGAPQKSRT